MQTDWYSGRDYGKQEGSNRKPAASRKGDAGVNSPTFGALPDFGNIDEGTDVYQTVRKLMKYAKPVSACNRLLKRLRGWPPAPTVEFRLTRFAEGF